MSWYIFIHFSNLPSVNTILGGLWASLGFFSGFLIFGVGVVVAERITGLDFESKPLSEEESSLVKIILERRLGAIRFLKKWHYILVEHYFLPILLDSSCIHLEPIPQSVGAAIFLLGPHNNSLVFSVILTGGAHIGPHFYNKLGFGGPFQIIPPALAAFTVQLFRITFLTNRPVGATS